jgi:hypothetical protein
MKTETILSFNTGTWSGEQFFKNRKMAVCSMHGKDLVMRPLIERYLHVNVVSVDNINTDEFGTFSGEVERPFDPITTLRMKILKGLHLSGETIGIGNEGSFGPHPQNLLYLPIRKL